MTTILGFVTGPSSVVEGTNASVAYTSSWKSDDCLEGFGGDDVNENYLMSFTNSNPTIWLSFVMYVDHDYSSSGIIFQMNQGTTPVARLYSNSSETLALQLHNGSDWVTVITSDYLAFKAKRRYDVKLTLNDTTGEFTVYVDGILFVTYSGDTIQGSYTAVDNISFQTVFPYLSEDVCYSAVFAADDDTRAIRMVQHLLNAAGTHSDFSGTYADVDEVGVSAVACDADYISSGTPNHVSTFDKSALPSEFDSGFDVIAQGVYARGKSSDIGTIPNAQLVLSDGTNDSVSGNKALDIVYNPIQHVYHTPPDGGAWSIAKANATEAGVKLIGS